MICDAARMTQKPTKTFLDKTYKTSGDDAMQALYDDWADSYEAEVGENGYATPARLARALAQLSQDKSQPILDYGCGTGLSGQALAEEGFATIDGMDPSTGMLAQCRKRGCRRRGGQASREQQS